MLRKFAFQLLAPDPADPGDPGKTDPKPDPKTAPAPDKKPDPDQPPGSPVVVKKSPIKTPAEIRLEKEVAYLRDELDGFKTWREDVNRSLEGLSDLDKPAPKKNDAPNFFDTLEQDIWGSR